jgi:SAM-dependent methyltransferase
MEARLTDRESVDRAFREQIDPFLYTTNPLEQTRFCRQRELLDIGRAGKRFERAVEIGSAEGVFTEMLAEICESLLVLDLSPTALERTRRRRDWGGRVKFQHWDLVSDPLPGQFDLIVAAGVLEYFKRPGTLRLIREKLTGSLGSGGLLLLESTRANPVIENAWWGKRLIRGKWINGFVAEHPSLQIVKEVCTDQFVITLFQSTLHEGYDGAASIR